jgi:hypothetical protein
MVARSGRHRLGGSRRRGHFELTPEQAALLADEDHPAFLAGGFGLLFSLFERWERLHGSFRTGRGTAYNDLGREHARNEIRFSAPWMRANLVPVILPGLDGVTGRLAVRVSLSTWGFKSPPPTSQQVSEPSPLDPSVVCSTRAVPGCARTGATAPPRRWTGTPTPTPSTTSWPG